MYINGLISGAGEEEKGQNSKVPKKGEKLRVALYSKKRAGRAVVSGFFDRRLRKSTFIVLHF